MNLRSLVSLAAVVASLVVPAVASAQQVPFGVPVQPRTVYVPAQGPGCQAQQIPAAVPVQPQTVYVPAPAPGYQAQRPYGGRRMDMQRAIEAQRIAELQRIEEARRFEMLRAIEARRIAQLQRFAEQRRMEEASRGGPQRFDGMRHPHMRGPFVAIRPERAPRWGGRR